MQKFLDPITNEPWHFQDDVTIEGNQFFDALGNRLKVPETLIPLPEGWVPPDPPPPTLDQIHIARLAAYRAESDPLKIEAEYDGLTADIAPDYTRWRAAVEAIKARYPLPAA